MMYFVYIFFVFFFFKQKTAYEMRISDLSSDVCSSDLNAGAVLKCPTFVEHEPMDHRHGHEIFEPFQGTHDQRPMRPRASHGNVEVVSVRLRGILPPVPGNHVTKLRFRPDKPSA